MPDPVMVCAVLLISALAIFDVFRHEAYTVTLVIERRTIRLGHGSNGVVENLMRAFTYR